MTVVFAVLAVLGLSVLVIVHELGHYLVARAFGMRVLRFSIGFGPVIAKYQPKGSPTTFQVCAIPLLAYVQIAGMNPAEEVDPNDPELYPNKGVLARILTIFAGPFANYLAASALVFGLAMAGFPEEEVPVEPMMVAAVAPGSPAAKAGLKPGDRIVEAEGRKVHKFEDLIRVTGPRAGKPTSYVLLRDRKRMGPLTITPMKQGDHGVIGVTAKFIRRRQAMSIGEAATAAIVFPYRITMAQLSDLRERFVRRNTEGIVGPVGMFKIVADRAQHGVAEYVWILMLLSVALGMFNLLPLPALDGGRLVFLAFEVVTRRRPDERLEGIIHMVGLLFLLGVLVLVSVRDVRLLNTDSEPGKTRDTQTQRK